MEKLTPKTAISILLLLFCSGYLLAQTSVLKIGSDFTHQSFAKEVLKLDQSYRAESFDEAGQLLEKGYFLPNAKPNIHIPIGEYSAYYFLSLENQTDQNKDLVVEINNFWIENLEALVETQEESKHFYIGNQKGFHGKAIPHRLALIPVQCPPFATSKIMIKASGGAQNASSGLKVYTRSAFDKKDNTQTIYTTIIWALNTLFFIIAIFINLFKKGIEFRLYLLYAFGTWGLVSGITKIPYQLLYPTYGRLASIEVMIFALFSSFSLLFLIVYFFKRSSLGLWVRHHSVKLLTLCSILLAAKCFQTILYDFKILSWTIIPMSFITSIFILVSIIIVIQEIKKDRSLEALMFLFVLLIYLLIAIFSVLINQNVIEVSIDTPIVYAVSSIIELGIITLLILRYVVRINKEKRDLGMQVEKLSKLKDPTYYGDYRKYNGKNEKPAESFIEKVNKEIKKNFKKPDFDVEELANSLHLSRSQLYRKVKVNTDKSIVEYIRFVRLKEGQEMLKNSSKKVGEIAYEIGFNDPAYFSRAFKKEFGKTPQEYREDHSG